MRPRYPGSGRPASASCVGSGVRRVVIVGNSGSGKTTLADHGCRTAGRAARRARCALPPGRVDSDSAGGVRRSRPEGPGCSRCCVRRVGRVRQLPARAHSDLGAGRHDRVAGPASPARDVARDESLVRRVLRRTELWNGNRESPANLLALHDPERSVVRWAWDGVERYRRLYVPGDGQHDVGGCAVVPVALAGGGGRVARGDRQHVHRRASDPRARTSPIAARAIVDSNVEVSDMTAVDRYGGRTERRWREH